MKIAVLVFTLIAFNAQSQELFIEIGQIKSLIKSSKVGYEDSFLFIGKIDSLKEVSAGVEDELLNQGELVEFLIPKSVCYDEVKLGMLTNKKFKLSISNLKKSFFKIVDKPEYKAFLKASVLTSTEKSSASCKFTLL